MFVPHSPGQEIERDSEMAKIGFIVSTVDGHTLEICNRLVQVAAEAGFETSVVKLTADANIDLSEFDRIVIGASVRYGKHRPEVVRLINDNLDILRSKQAAFFSVNAVARKPEKREPHTNPYVRKFFQSVAWEPALIGIFGGRIDYSMYRFWDRTMIRFIMWMTKGPTALDSKVDFTDWSEVEAFGRALCASD
jgi:menaquinone-dependent protoporphyrinogen oxidase